MAVEETVSMETRYKAAMVLCGVGDCIAYKNGEWEFCHSGERIHKELKELGGLEKLHPKPPKWIVSDDTVLSLSTAESLIKMAETDDREKLFSEIALKYKNDVARDMGGRAPGFTTQSSCSQLKPERPDGYRVPFSGRAGGCGAAMRSMCIGLRYPKITDESCLEELIAVSIESGRMTHHHPTGYLGGLASAFLTACAVTGVPIQAWGAKLLEILPKAWKYVENKGIFVEENRKTWGYFKEKWERYLKLRGIEDGESPPKFPDEYGIKTRDEFYKSLSFSGWGGSSGHDAPMIAYDAILAAGDSWGTLCSHGMFHSGDSDSTGVIAGCLFGAKYGYKNVPKNNYKDLEYYDRLATAGSKLYDIAKKNGFV